MILLDRDGNVVVAYDDATRTPPTITFEGRLFEFEDHDGSDAIYREVE